jgi:hypothetical protein
MGRQRLLRAVIGILFSTLLSAQTFRLADPVMANPRGSGWTAEPGMGALRFSLPVGTVAGEIPIPVALAMGGTFEAYQMWLGQNNAYFDQEMDVPIFATCGFGYLGIQNGPDMSAFGAYLALEDGSTYGMNEFSSRSQGASLLGAYGFTTIPAYLVHSSGTLLWATQTEAEPGGILPFPEGTLVHQNLPVGFTLNIVVPSGGGPSYKMIWWPTKTS